MITTSYFCATVTLAAAGTKYSLYDLLKLIDPDVPPTGREVNLQVEDAPAGNVRIGDSTVSAVNCGYKLVSGASRLYRDRQSTIPLVSLYLLPSVNAMLINVEIIQ
jgi:hypothetical protein